jgi:flagellar biosynthesis GTPase FlhF
MSVASTSSFTSVTSSAGKAADLEKKAAAASAALVEKMRTAAEEKAKKAAEKEAAKAAAAAEKEAIKAAKEEEKALKKAEKEAAAAAAKAAKEAEKAAKKAAKEAEEAAKPKRPVGRPRKEASPSPSAAGGAGGAGFYNPFDTLREPLPSITPKMRGRLAAVDLLAPEVHPVLFSTEGEAPTDPEALAAENARLRAQLAALTEAYGRQRAAISHTMEVLGSC